MSGKGYTLLERHRKDQRRGYVLLLSSLLYFLAILLDRSLLIPQWKYHQQSEASSNLIQQSQTTKDDKLTVTKLPPSESNKDSTECESLLHNDYKNSHTIIETNGSPHPHTVVFAPPTSQSIITKHLIKDGVWELSLYRKIKQKINPGMTFLDVGANMGLFSIYAQSIGANVIAVEAMESNANFIAASQCLNSFLGGKTNPSPVSSPGTIRLYNYPAHPFPDGFDCHVKGASNNRDDGHLLCTEKKIGNSENMSTTATAQQPRMARLDSIIDDALGSGSKQQQIDLMKIDVEGFEQAVMESASGLHRPPLGIVFECDAKQANKKGHSTLFWRRYLEENSDRCNGFTYSVDPSVLSLTLPYFPFVDAIALGTCGGGNFYLDCSGFAGEGIIFLLWRWSANLFFITSFVLGLRILIRLDGGSGHFNDAVKPRWNAYVFVSVMRQKRFAFAVGAIAFLTILCRCLFLV